MEKSKLGISLLLGTFLVPVVSYGSADFSGADAQFAGVIVSDEALFEAIKAQDINRVSYLLDHGANVNALRIDIGKYANTEQTPLTEAIVAGNIDMVRLLLDRKANIDVHLKVTSNNSGEKWWYRHSTPLSAAIWAKNIDMVCLLLEYGADINTRMEYMEQGMEGWILFTRYSCPLVDAIWNGNIDMVRFLLEQGANVNTEGGTAFVPLIAATNAQNLDMVSLLLEQREIRVNATHNINLTWDEYESRGYVGEPYNIQIPTTALRNAGGNDQIVRLLLAHGAHW
jgi:ankyrin repeat protein